VNAVGIYNAGQTIKLEPGFLARKGCYFHAYIEGCTNTNLKSGESFYKSEAGYSQSSILPATAFVNVSPNPSNGNIIIKVNISDENTYDLKVLNLYGHEMTYKKYLADKSLFLDLSNYPKGVYILQIQSSGKLFTQKIVLN
jgi:hypothetical protein